METAKTGRKPWRSERSLGKGGDDMDFDISGIIQLALQQGIWAALYIYLFFRMLKENADREAKYQAIIDRLSGNIEEGIENIQARLDTLGNQKAP
jgi:hypothetical protein